MSAILERADLKAAVLPYFVDKPGFPDDIFALLHRRLEREDLLADVFYEREPTVEEFTKLLGADSLTYIFLDIESGQYCGLAWLSLVEDGAIKRACANVVFFRDFQIQAVTKQFGVMLLSQLFNIMSLDIVWALTPSTNTLSRKYCARLGMSDVARLPFWTRHRGQATDGVVFMLTRDEFNRSLE